jgi:subtilisin family serine protease
MLLPTLLLAAAGAEVHPTHLLVKPLRERTAADVSAAERASRATLVREIPALGWRVLDVAPERLESARDELIASGAFEHVDFDRAKKLAYVPNDPYWPGMWHAQKIRADVAWNTSFGSSSIVVAVIDTGLETTHPDLAANVWTNAGEIPANGVDDDSNGYEIGRAHV